MRKTHYFILHTRSGDSFACDFKALKQETQCQLHLICATGMEEQVKQYVEESVFTSIHYVSEKPDFADLTAIIDSLHLASGTFDIGTVSESRVNLVGKIRQYYGLSNRDYSRFVDKDAMKEELSKYGVRVPTHRKIDREKFRLEGRRYVERLLLAVGIPAFVKPLSMFGAIKTAKIEKVDELCAWLRSSEGDGHTYEIEEFVDGTLYISDSVVADGAVLFNQICEYSTPCADSHQGKPLGWISLPHDDAVAKRLALFSKYIHEVLMPNESGVTHLEIFRKGNELIFLEIAKRPVGLVPVDFYKLRAGVDLKKMHHQVQIHPKCNPDLESGPYVCFYFFPLPLEGGVVSKISMPNIESQFLQNWHYAVGEQVNENCGLDAAVATFVLWNHDFATLKRDFETLRNFKLIDVSKKINQLKRSM